MAKRTPSKPNLQWRTIEIRAKDDSTDAGFTGYASVFGNVDAYGTAIAKGAFKKTLQERGGKIPVLWQHDSYTPIGKPTEIKEDAKGLYVDSSIDEGVTYGREAMSLLRHGVPLGLSIGFEIIKSRPYEAGDDDALDWSGAPSWAEGPGREYVRVIEELGIWEYSIVTFAGNEQVSIDDVRSRDLGLLTSLTEALRSGDIADGDERLALLHPLVAAYQQRSEPKPDPDAGTTPLDPEARHRNRLAELALIELGSLWSPLC